MAHRCTVQSSFRFLLFASGAALLFVLQACNRVNVNGSALVIYQDGEYWVVGAEGGGLVKISDATVDGEVAYFSNADCIVVATDSNGSKQYHLVLPDASSRFRVVYPIPIRDTAAAFEQLLAKEYSVSLPTNWDGMLVIPEEFIARRGGWH